MDLTQRLCDALHDIGVHPDAINQAMDDALDAQERERGPLHLAELELAHGPTLRCVDRDRERAIALVLEHGARAATLAPPTADDVNVCQLTPGVVFGADGEPL